MRALVWNGPNNMTLEPLDRPRPSAGEALIRISAIGICGSDIHGYTGETGRRSPGMVMGHEFAGAVEELDSDTKDISVGDRVAVNPMRTCGTCRYCQSGEAQACPDRKVLGVNMGTAGAFSDYVVAPIENLVRLADNISNEQGTMAEPLAVGLRGVDISGLKANEPTLILGAGTIGLCMLLVCRSRGIGPVFITDKIQHRLELARKLGATVVPADQEASAAVLGATDGDGAPVALDAVGVSATLLQGLKSIRRQGKVVLVGLGTPKIDLSVYDMVPQERAIWGSYAYSPAEYKEAARLINNGEVDVTPLIERTVAFEDTVGAIEDLARGRDESVKVVVRM